MVETYFVSTAPAENIDTSKDGWRCGTLPEAVELAEAVLKYRPLVQRATDIIYTEERASSVQREAGIIAI